MIPEIRKIACVASDTPKAQERIAILNDRYSLVDIEEADALVSLGGDGFMLQTVHKYIDTGIPIYGMNCGSIGSCLTNSPGQPPRTTQHGPEHICIHCHHGNHG